MGRHIGFCEKRRAQLARRFAPDQLERRNTITEPISVSGLAIPALSALVRLGMIQAGSLSGGPGLVARPDQTAAGGQHRGGSAGSIPTNFLPITVDYRPAHAPAGGGPSAQDAAGSGAVPKKTQPSDGLRALFSTDANATETGISKPWHAGQSPAGGGALRSRGGSGGLSPAMPAAGHRAAVTTVSQGPDPAAPASSSAAASSALLSALGFGAGTSAAPASALAGGTTRAVATTISRNAPAVALHGGGLHGPGGRVRPLASPAFEVETLDYNDGTVMFPGFDQLATPGGSVDLRAQVRDSAAGTYTFSWSTGGLTDATSISGANTYDLTFQWNTTVSTAKSESTTLTVTDPNNSTVSQTYTFWVPAGTGTSTGGTTWNNQTLDPGLIQADAPAFASQNVSVVAATGALETQIALPSYNPNVAPVVLDYDSLAANALPIIVAEHQLDPTKAAPSQVSAQLTLNGTAGSTYYFSTSSLTPGDIMQIGLQADAHSLSTGRYSYTETIIDYRGGTPTTFTYNGTATVENAAEDATFSALGAGWTVAGLNKIISATGGVILDQGDGSVEWFSGSFGGGGGTYTSTPGDFSTLTLNSNGTYTRTLTDGTVQNFSSGGFETTSVDRNGLTTTYGYTGNLLTTITDPFSQAVTLTYNGSNQLQSIKDPASRFTTFTMSGGDLTAVEYPDQNTWDYGYDGSGRMTSVTEPSSTGEPTKITTIVYDSAERVRTITRADSTTEEFSPAQVQGWTNSGTSGSPVSSTLLAEVGSTYTDPLSNVTTERPDWRGMGLTDETTDALSNVTTYDRNSNGLATITIDPLNRIAQFAYDSKGNITKEIYPDLTTTTFGTYNSFAEPSTVTDQLNNTTSFTYDSHGNMTVLETPLDYVATYVYSATQPGMLTSQTAPAPAGQSSYTLVSYQDDSSDRLTTITNADNDVTVKSYSSAGQVTKVTDPSTNVTSYSFDGMNRETGMTVAAGSSIAGVYTYTFDAAGNQVTSENPDSDITTTTYDALDRVSTVKTPDGGVTSYSYDNDGRLHLLTDPVNNVTTFQYDALGRQTQVTSPSVNNSNGVSATFVYDADGELVDTTDSDGRRTTYSYDQLGRQTGESWLNGSGTAIYVATFVYDSDGHMTGANNPNATVTFTYDADGDLQTEASSGPGTGQPSVTLTYGYDPSGDVTSIKDSLSGSGGAGQGITSFVYDNALRLTTITQSFGGTAGPQIVDSYNADGLISETARTVSGGTVSVNTTYSYDAANNMTDICTQGQSHAPNDSITRAILPAYDAAGRTTTVTVTINGIGTSTTYSYDSSGQVTGSTGSSNNSYSYDANGNRNSTGYTTGAGNELTHSPGVSYTYDNAGNTVTSYTSSSTTTYTYDYDNRMTNVQAGGTMVATYVYDALGRRIGIDDSGTQTWTVFNGNTPDSNPYGDFNSSGNVTMRYLYGPAVDQILARTNSSAVTAWYITDEIGSVRFVDDTAGDVLDKIVYDPFGNIVSETNASNGDRFKFAGMEWDSVAGLFYDHARYYDPVTGRFMSQDPMGFAAGDTNLYRYVDNAPSDVSDPTGMLTATVEVSQQNVVTIQYKPGYVWQGGLLLPEPLPTEIHVHPFEPPNKFGIAINLNPPPVRKPVKGGVIFTFKMRPNQRGQYVVQPVTVFPRKPGKAQPPDYYPYGGRPGDHIEVGGP
jgi:RHS repeat-associated protein